MRAGPARPFRTVLCAAELREKAAALVRPSVGLRPGALGNFLGDDGRVIGDLPEVGAKTVRFPKTPTPIVVRRHLSKANPQYFTFTREEGAAAVVDHLHSRVEAGAR